MGAEDGPPRYNNHCTNHCERSSDPGDLNNPVVVEEPGHGSGPYRARILGCVKDRFFSFVLFDH